MKLVLPVLACVVFAVSIVGQTTNKKPVKKTPRTAPTVISTPAAPTPEPVEPIKTPAKRNERPTNNNQNPVDPVYKPTYFYDFAQPDFTVSKILIEHDENGVGRISLMKKDWTDMDSDPIRISESALARIRAAFESLDFLNSTTSYDYEKDYSHLGVHKFKLTRDGKTRETRFSWTENKAAKVLMDEYRKIGNQFIWIFDMNVARTNQPLNAPMQMALVDGYLERNELSDPMQLIAYLKEVSRDERIPLMARNHATRLIEKIEKDAAKD